MFSCYIFLLSIVEAEILRAICVYVYNNFLFLRTLHLFASLARRNTNCSVSCFFFSLLYSLCNQITLPPSTNAWFAKLGWNVASLNLSSCLCQENRSVFPPAKGLKSWLSASLLWLLCAHGVGILCSLIGRMSGIKFVPKQLRPSGLADTWADSVEF